MRFETGHRPGQEIEAAATVSTGAHDPGGVSYGAYQFTSSAAGGAQVQAFLHHEGARWAHEFAGLDPTRPNGAFAARWRAVAAREPQQFFDAQHGYIARTHNAPVVAHVRENTGLDVSTRSQAVQNAVWSMAVQHGRAARLVEQAVRQTGPQGSQTDTAFDRRLINALYDVRDAYVTAQGLPDLTSRYAAERADALHMLDAAH